ncbi:hypothetical protein StrepF001_13420 [Streptomyces sp. F001]|nr:hypothetical protein StrepF001_13420 [Streptomyces sp. F001]
MRFCSSAVIRLMSTACTRRCISIELVRWSMRAREYRLISLMARARRIGSFSARSSSGSMVLPRAGEDGA